MSAYLLCLYFFPLIFSTWEKATGGQGGTGHGPSVKKSIVKYKFQTPPQPQPPWPACPNPRLVVNKTTKATDTRLTTKADNLCRGQCITRKALEKMGNSYENNPW